MTWLCNYRDATTGSNAMVEESHVIQQQSPYLKVEEDEEQEEGAADDKDMDEAVDDSAIDVMEKDVNEASSTTDER